MPVPLGHEGRTHETECSSYVVFSLIACSRGRVASERGGTVDTFGCAVIFGIQQSNRWSSSGGGSGSVQLW